MLLEILNVDVSVEVTVLLKPKAEIRCVIL